ncbi:hypothetical protein CKQ90_34560, partial [Klebsiella pneumoniae]
MAVSAPPAMHLPFTSPREGEKLLRLLPLTTPQGRYHYRLRAPTRRRVAVSAPPAMHLPFTSPREGEKLLRLL